MKVEEMCSEVGVLLVAGKVLDNGGVTLPGLVAYQPEIAVIEQSGQRLADCSPVLISKGVGAQIDIRPSEGLL